MKEVVVTATTPAASRPMVQELDSHFIPDAVLVVATQENYEEIRELSPLLEGRTPEEKATTYICEKSVCKRPITAVEDLAKALQDQTTQSI